MAGPTIVFSQFSSSGVNPGGSRHLTNHASYIKRLNASVSGVLDFGKLNLSGGINHSPTKTLIARASSMGTATEVFDMKFWSPARPTPVGNIYFNFKTLNNYVSGIALTNASGAIPTSLPSSPNLLRQNGAVNITRDWRRGCVSVCKFECFSRK
jgi:hypothetical protein